MSTSSLSRRGRRSRRARLAVAAACILVAGLAVHAFADGPVGGFAGDALYAALIAVIVAFAVPRAARWVAPVVALAFCWAIEVLQLTPLPRAIEVAVPGSYFVFGSTFQWIDLVAYAVGVAVVAAVSRPAAGSSRDARTTPSGGAPERRPPEGTPSR
ncbi:DUF2809 domain-containing protein [Leifsonia sp. PS1209]|uniref:ribosomal maturation YjgA family protein n=1 Tax=Leifsonia sp. PS1209 TaxID=2724914 RepID=UPI001442BDEE|nr:DUF2809 domain-containing protein [Leifsonia sp. PS1209]QIZ98421.1 DUF2809 domain-containing protein [Leifsonia sp. PS1209]